MREAQPAADDERGASTGTVALRFTGALANLTSGDVTALLERGSSRDDDRCVVGANTNRQSRAFRE